MLCVSLLLQLSEHNDWPMVSWVDDHRVLYLTMQNKQALSVVCLKICSLYKTKQIAACIAFRKFFSLETCSGLSPWKSYFPRRPKKQLQWLGSSRMCNVKTRSNLREIWFHWIVSVKMLKALAQSKKSWSNPPHKEIFQMVLYYNSAPFMHTSHHFSSLSVVLLQR